MSFLDEIKFDVNGLVPVIVQDAETTEVLMLAYMSRETLRETVKGKRPVFWSRSRKSRWVKGETSGNTQQKVKMLVDCDMDTLLIKVKQKGGACHTGYRSCFYRKVLKEGDLEIVGEITAVDKRMGQEP